jgi:hypothetical protein
MYVTLREEETMRNNPAHRDLIGFDLIILLGCSRLDDYAGITGMAGYRGDCCKTPQNHR